MKVKTLVLTGYGINCEKETAECFNRAGSKSEIRHINEIITNPKDLELFHLLALPGGFSYGDHIASGKIFANKLKYFLKDEINNFIKEGKGVIGICNGFQVLVKAGILPGWNNFTQEVSITYNQNGKFENRWVQLKINHENNSFWIKYDNNKSNMELPVRHGEGRFVISLKNLEKLLHQNLVALTYQDEFSNSTINYPNNPNGSIAGIAGITNNKGNVFGLMPHPEAYMIPEQAPNSWANKPSILKQYGKEKTEGLGMKFFHNGVKAMIEKFNLT